MKNSPLSRALPLVLALVLTAASSLFSPPVVHAQEPASPASTLSVQAAQALDEGLPQVAVYKSRAFLRTSHDAASRREAVFTLVRALLAMPDAAVALTTLDTEFPLPPTRADQTDPALAFWRGQTLAALGRWSEALVCYTRAEDVFTPDSTLSAPARFGRGEASLALTGGSGGDAKLLAEATAIFRGLCEHPSLGAAARLRYAEISLNSHHLKEAQRVLVDPLPGGRPENTSGHPLAKEHAYLVGRLRLAQRQPALAQRIFAAALEPPDGLSDRLLVDLIWGQTRAYLDEDQPDLAQSGLENLLENSKYLYPRQPYLPTIFSWLESLYSRLPNPDLTDLQHWAQDDGEPAREALARLTLAHLEIHAKRFEEADELLSDFDEAFPDHPLRVRALLDLAALRLSLGQGKEARETLARARQAARDSLRWRTGIETLAAQLDLAENDHLRAAQRFEELANQLGSAPGAEAAAFNAVVASLRSGDNGRLAEATTAFNRRFPRSAFAAEFVLEEGLTRAESVLPADEPGHQEAAAILRRFLQEHPHHSRTVEARIALAELAFQQSPPDLPMARRELAAPELRPVSNDAPDSASPTDRDRADYLAIWLADAPSSTQDPDNAITLAKNFLAARADSPLAAEVRMKLGEMYFAQGDYADAQTQLEQLGRQTPSSPLADAALYLAGRSAVYLAGRTASGTGGATALDQAVGLFNQAAKHPGPFRLPARLRLAELMLGKPDNAGARDALFLYEDVLSATAGTAALSEGDLDARCAALSGRGQALLALAENDPSLYRKALDSFDQLATGTPGTSLRWRRQALTLKGGALEKTGDTEGALAAYDDAINAAPEPGAEGSTEEWTWFYRAGHEAARLLEAQSQWAAAIAIYKKLAAADGPLKSEFETTLARRRLEHFIWED